MRTFWAFVQHAHEQLRHQMPSPGRAGRWAIAIAIAASLASSALGAATPVRADDPPVPAARLQVVVKKIHINNDRDGWGSGEMRLYVQICPQDGPANVIQHGCENATGFAARYDFSADSGTDVFPNRALPAVGDFAYGDASIESGTPVYAGQTYILQTGMLEDDTFGGDDMGITLNALTAENGWQIGEHTQLGSAHSDGAPFGRSDYVITYEIVRTPLPDLHVRGLRIIPGTPRFWCAQIENIGQRSSRLVSMNVTVDGKLLRQTILPALEVGAATEHCVASTEIPAPPVTLGFFVDQPGQVDEMDETNNTATIQIQTTAAVDGAGASGVSASPEPVAPEASPAAGPKHTVPDEQATPTPKPNTSKNQADLSVRALHLDDQTPDGKNGCTADVTAVVKNGGSGAAGSFTTRLLVDGKGIDQTVDGLDAGQQQNVTFSDVRLGPGEHTLKAVADPDNTVAERKPGNDDNNERTVSARCKKAGG